jgi:capsid protein
MTRAQTLRTPDRVARSAIARSGVQREDRRAAAQYLFLKNWIPDLRGGSATACPGHEAVHRHL